MSIKVGIVGSGKKGVFGDLNIADVNKKTIQDISSIVVTNYGIELSKGILEIISDFSDLCSKEMDEQQKKAQRKKIKNINDMISLITAAFLLNVSVMDEDLSGAIEIISMFCTKENEEFMNKLIASDYFIYNVDDLIGKESEINIVKNIACLIIDHVRHITETTSKHESDKSCCCKETKNTDTESYCKCDKDDGVINFVKEKSSVSTKKQKPQVLEIKIAEDSNGNISCDIPSCVSDEDKTRILSMLGYEVKK